MDTAVLIREAKQGSASAQKCLFDLYAMKMLTVCRRYVKVEQDAEEILLDGFYKFFKAVHDFDFQSDAALSAWIKKIMINECLMHLRRKNNFNIVADTSAEEVPLEADALDQLSVTEIIELITALPTGYRTVFNLHVMEGMGHSEIAGFLGISEGTSKSQLSRAKTLLQKMLLKKGTTYGQRQIK